MTMQSTYAVSPTETTTIPVPLPDPATDAATLSALRDNSPGRGILVTGGTIRSQDPGIGNLLGDNLFRADKIVEIGPGLSAPAAALVVLDAGTTTIIDNSHNTRSPEHAGAAIEALWDAGVRGVHASGPGRR